ncbi:JAB domain-containing protein [Novosphingobium pentaromativorans]|uniref:DNA repair protein RadC-like protein n=1 Tax=Novosphingobium pentaromativorans US6-1 TaxID=1088721 RepID=G6EEJ2_9SPHN|nr:JAB domain-containing protein [Novosphingobium pentaromativorans]AIT79420.1 DNA repair protein RadC [Novosphingobium pentaromativorans US6-1]EHJ60237.1 DNA repair protein RadC-like protein [Novosphingobium pentaromativorans US6-1]
MSQIGGLRHEVVVALLFDGRGILLSSLSGSEGARASVSGRYRPLLKQIFDVDASGLVLVHNHPSGDPSPSAADIAATRRLGAIARVVEVDFFDHLVIAGRMALSMRRAGLMTGRTGRSRP